MYAVELSCLDCEWKTGLGNLYACENCGYSLDVVYNYGKIDKDDFRTALENYRSVWDFKVMLPVKNCENIVTLQEGNTPLIESQRIGKDMGINLYLKDESRNPTASFKDRPNTVGISTAKDHGLNIVTIASSGNAGSSLSAFAAKAGMKCYVFIPEKTPVAKVIQTAIHGARIIKVRGHYSNSFNMANSAAEKYNWVNMTSTYLNPYTVEGDKTIAYEICAQLGGKTPDWIVVPISAGAMLSGIYKGFKEMSAFGFSDGNLPRMIGVQAKGCSPITGAFEKGLETVEAFENPNSIAGAICDPLIGYSQDGTRTLRVIRKSGGVGISVSDESITKCQRELAEQEGIFCELASAASLSAVYGLLEKGVIEKGKSVVAILTAHGLKGVEGVANNIGSDVDVISSLSELETLLGK